MKSSFFLLLICLFGVALAQNEKPVDFGIKSKKAMNLYLEGREQVRYRDHKKAAELFAEAIKLEPDFAAANYSLGEEDWLLRKYAEAIPYLEKVAASSRAGQFPTLYCLLGEVYFFAAKYEESVTAYEKYLANPKGAKSYLDAANKNYPKAKFAAQEIKHPVKFVPQNLGSAVNTAGEEYLPFLTADDKILLFTSQRSENTGGFNAEYRSYPEDIYTSEYKEGQWTEAKNLGLPINTDKDEGAASITQDGRIVFFAADYPTGFGGYDIYYTVFSNGKWTRPENLGANINSNAWDSQPFLSPDGKTLYFSSKRSGGLGGHDIWYCKWENNKWSPAKNIGKPINTGGSEQCPFIHADGETMYFASNFHPGFGEQDIFVTHLVADSGWTMPKNLGYPINTPADEGNIFVNTKGTRAFIESRREGGFGGMDLYEFGMDPIIRPKVSTFLRGVTRDSLTKAPIAANIKLIDVETGDTIRTITASKNEGKFLMSLPMNKEYAAFAEANGYMFSSENFYLKDLPEDVYFDIMIDMMPIPVKPAITSTEPPKTETPVVVVLHNVFFGTGSYALKTESFIELDVLLSYLQKNPRLKIEVQGHTDNVGAEASNLELSQERANSVAGYLTSKGISPTRITAVGYGESQPIAPNDTPEGRSQNRRTAFRIMDF